MVLRHPYQSSFMFGRSCFNSEFLQSISCIYIRSLCCVQQALIAGTVQLFFAWRVKVLTTNWWMVLIVVIASLTGLSAFLPCIVSLALNIECSLVGGLITTYEVGVTPHFVNFRHFKVGMSRFCDFNLVFINYPLIVVRYYVVGRWMLCGFGNYIGSCLASVS